MRGFLLLLVLIFLSSAVYGGKKIKKCYKKVKELEIQVAELEKTIEEMKENQTKVYKRNCAELYKSGQTISGVYTIDPDGSGAFDVFCDQTSAGGGWTVFQKRINGSVDFYLNWTDYTNGFGNLDGEFWLGLEKIHRLTKSEQCTLRVDLEDWEGGNAYAEYDDFVVSNGATKYQLSIGTYTGTAGDALSYHRDAPFSTKDQDNDSYDTSCAVEFKGAWWYTDCHTANLNGLYHQGGQHSSFADGINWKQWKGYYYSAKTADMKIRPAKF